MNHMNWCSAKKLRQIISNVPRAQKKQQQKNKNKKKQKTKKRNQKISNWIADIIECNETGTCF